MKAIGTSTLALVLFASAIFGQSKTALGVNAEFVLPTGKTADKYKQGFGGGAWAALATSSASIAIALGLDYFSLGGKTQTEHFVVHEVGYTAEWTTITTYKDIHCFSAYAGPKIGKEDGVYLLPAISANYADAFGAGYYIGAGFLKSLKAFTLHVGAKYGVPNVIGKGHEDPYAGVAILVGGVF